MKKSLIIPAIDIIDGKCVRLSQGDYAQKKIYNESPLEVAKSFESHGIERLHLVDLDGAKSASVVNWKVLESIANNTNLIIDFGGGVKSDKDIKTVFEAGAAQVTAGSIAVKSPETVYAWMDKYGADKLILGADAKDKKIAINGWKEATAIELDDFLSGYLSKGLHHVICTDIAKDGMMGGASVELYAELIEKFNTIQLIASGGVHSMEEVYKLQENGLYGIIIGKAIYEGAITLKQLEQFIIN